MLAFCPIHACSNEGGPRICFEVLVFLVVLLGAPGDGAVDVILLFTFIPRGHLLGKNM